MKKLLFILLILGIAIPQIATGDVKVYPYADSTTTLEVVDADGNTLVAVDTVNDRVGIGETPTATLHLKAGTATV